MNKKVLALIAAFVLLILAGIAVYTVRSKDTPTQKPAPAASSEPKAEPTPEPAPEPTPEPTPEPAPESTPEPTPEIVPEGEAGKHADGSITLDDGYTLSPERAKGVYVPLDQVLTYIQTNYGTDALGTITELMNKGKTNLNALQGKLAKHSAEDMKNIWIPQYKEILESVKDAEYWADHMSQYDPNKIYENS